MILRTNLQVFTGDPLMYEIAEESDEQSVIGEAGEHVEGHVTSQQGGKAMVALVHGR